MSLATADCVISVMPVVIRGLGISKKMNLFTLVTKFSKLVELTFSWPQAYVDGIGVCVYVHGSTKKEYFRDPQRLAEIYINGVNSQYIFCPLVQRLLDLPWN